MTRLEQFSQLLQSCEVKVSVPSVLVLLLAGVDTAVTVKLSPSPLPPQAPETFEIKAD
ncbi:MAG: hypothetical protein H6658_11915 [Ardenticatenaceae bacterium]|nr:hypothetical protein [Ardenticatenaceae bacterium]